MKIKTLAAAFAALATICGPAAHAGVVFSDGFDGENGGASALNYTGFANWSSTGTGGVDLVKSGDYGISCLGGGGSCVDLVGTPGPGQMITNQAFAFSKGSVVTLSFYISGDQRDSATTDFYAGFLFPINTIPLNFTEGGGWGPSVTNPGLISSIEQTYPVAANSPWTNYTESFVAGTAGSLQIYLGSPTTGNIGPVLDNVTLSITAVPEPATWAMLILGAAMIGLAARRRGAAVVA